MEVGNADVSAHTTDPDNGNGNSRATVALVDAKVDGLKELIRAEFGDVRRQLSGLGPLTAKVEGQGDRLLMLEGRVASLERTNENELSNNERRKNYLTVHLPSLLIGLLGVLAAILVTVIK